MKIARVTVDVLRVTVDNAYVAAGRQVDANWHVLARVETSDGVEGIGYIVYPRGDLMPAIAHATRELGEHLIGHHVLSTESAWEMLAKRGDWVGPGGLLHCAIAPLDIAMWDAAGKVLGQPVHRLLGGYRDRVPAYASDRLWYSLSLDDLAASAQQYAQSGFRALKLRLGKEASPQGEAQRVRTAQEAGGPDMQVMVDGTESWDRTRALQTGRVLQDEGITWLEDPVHHQDIEGLAQLSSTLHIPVTGGEHLYDLRAFRELLQARGVDVAILDLARVGGITPWRKIAALAQAYQTPVCGHVVPEIHVHLLASVPNGGMLEYMPRSGAILQTMPELVDGQVIAPNAAGLGLTLDETAVTRFRVG
jgi:L-alanine-DL-glutamate epimerase-like enolase superfamily enzyme